MKAHIIENGIVINTIEVKSLDFMPNLIDGSIGGIGWKYENGELIEPPKPVVPIKVPQSITPLQAKLQLHRVGLLDEVEAMVITDVEVRLYWEYALEIIRDHPTLLTMATTLGLSDEQLDMMFIEAGKIQ